MKEAVDNPAMETQIGARRPKRDGYKVLSLWKIARKWRVLELHLDSSDWHVSCRVTICDPIDAVCDLKVLILFWDALRS